VRWALALLFAGASGRTRIFNSGEFAASLSDLLFERVLSAANTMISKRDLHEELEERLRFETLLADLSARFVNVPADQTDHEIENAQRQICECLSIHQCSLWQSLPSDPEILLLTHLYRTHESELPPPPQRMKGEESFPWATRKLKAGEIVSIPKTTEAPPEAAVDKQAWMHYHVKSTLAIPLSAGGSSMVGVLSFDGTQEELEIPEPLQKRLQLISQVFASALARKRADQTLRDSEARLSLAAASANAGLWTLEPVSGQVWATEKTFELFGIPKDESLNLTRFLTLVHPDDRLTVTEAIKEAMESGKETRIEYRILQPDGSLHWIASRGRSHSGTSGQPDRLMGVSVDVTEPKNAEAVRLWHSAIVESSDDAIISKNLEGIITTWNRGAQRIFGYGEEEVVGQPITIIIPPELWSEEKEILRRLSAGEPIEHYEAIRITKENKRVHVSLTLSPIRDPSGTVIGVSKISRDITDRKRAESALRESEERFRTVANSAPVMIWMSGADKQCTFLNQRWLDFTGDVLKDALGEGWTSSVHPDDLDQCLGIYSRAFEARVDFETEYRLRRYDGEFRWVLDRGVPRFQSDGEFQGYIGSCIDLTDSRRVAEELKKSYEEVKKLKERLQLESEYLQEEIRTEVKYDEIVGRSDELKKVFQKIEQVARTDSVVLITGETGTGKELIARAIHKQSNRSRRVMVKIDCASLPSSLIESELFGREKGAYTGALTKQIGRFETADGSTLFLDEIGELPLELQAKLLRAVQDGNFERLGSPKTVYVDTRVIAATHRDLGEEVRAGRFREDLYYRLNVFPIHVPPLRERADDISLLVWAFVKDLEKKMGKRIDSITKRAMQKLQSYAWPGNIRELRNVIEQSIILTNGNQLNLQMPQPLTLVSSPTLRQAEYQHILSVLKKTNWQIKGPNGAAQILGMNSSTLYSTMRRLGIPTREGKDEMSA
jgi:PAS domain S-box-containing protein